MTRIALVLAVLLALGLLAGCAGGGGGSDGGSIRFTVTFPPLPSAGGSTRYIPPALMSLGIDVLDPDTEEAKVPRVIVNRPSPEGGTVSVSIPDVHTGDTLLVVKGYDQEDCQGQLICQASTTCTVNLNETAQVPMTMATTVVRVEVSGPAALIRGQIAALTPSGFDIDNSLVVDATFTWTTSNAGVVALGGAGVPPGSTLQPITAAGVGTATLTATAVGTAITGSLDIRVFPPPDRVDVQPTERTINQGLSFVISADCYAGETLLPDVPITFTAGTPGIVEIAPLTDNTARVTATGEGNTVITASQEFSSATGTCAVTVTATGGIDVGIGSR